jgi:hypothetical protein
LYSVHVDIGSTSLDNYIYPVLLTNNAVEGLNSTRNSIIGKNQSNVFLVVEKLKEEAELVSCQLKSKESGDPGQKRRKAR